MGVQSKTFMIEFLKAFLTWRLIPRGVDAGLLVLRLLAGASLFLKHGWEKSAHFAAMAAHFPDPIHLGPALSLFIASVSDVICSVLTMLGSATRWAALFVVVNVGVAWSMVHRFGYFAGPEADHGELCFLYITVFLALSLTGAGHYSVDSLIARKSYD